MNNCAVPVLENKRAPSNDIAPRGLEKDIVDISTMTVREGVSTDV